MAHWNKHTPQEIQTIKDLAQDPSNTRKKVAEIVLRNPNTIGRWATEKKIGFASGMVNSPVTDEEIEKLRVMGQDPAKSKSEMARQLHRCHQTVARVAKRKGIVIACRDARNTVATPELLRLAHELSKGSAQSESAVAKQLGVKRVTLRYWKRVGKV